MDLSVSVCSRFKKLKDNLNFGSRTDDDFLDFLISTVSSLVNNVRPVFEGSNSLTKSPCQSQTSYSSAQIHGSARKRLNRDRFHVEQVNKIMGSSDAPHDKDNDKENVECQTELDKAPGNLEPSPSQTPEQQNLTEKLVERCVKPLTPSQTLTPSRTFFSDIVVDDKDDLADREGHISPDGGVTYHRMGVTDCHISPDGGGRRVTDCHDKRCRYCPSYDPAYETAMQDVIEDTLEELEDLNYTELWNESPELLPEHPEQKGSVADYEDIQNDSDENKALCSWHDWSMMTALNETLHTTLPPSPTLQVPENVRLLSDKDLRSKLVDKGAQVGPITAATRYVYEQYLVKLGDAPFIPSDDSLVGYNRELVSCLLGQPQLDWGEAEQAMVEEYRIPILGRKYRQGTMKCFFNYLLLDPRIADDLPKLASTLSPQEIFKRFIKAVFYIGKGKQSRPYAHLFEATLQNKDNDKIKKIRSIWNSGRGVVSLHVFNNTIAEEAFIREAVMITCIGMKKLVNEKGGEFYGLSRSWSPAKKRGVGLSLLYKAHLTLINEGHREIRAADVSR